MEEFQILKRENQIWFSLHFNGLLQTQSKNRMVRSWHYGNGKNVCVCFLNILFFFYNVDNLLRSIFWIAFNNKICPNRLLANKLDSILQCATYGCGAPVRVYLSLNVISVEYGFDKINELFIAQNSTVGGLDRCNCWATR